MTATKQGERKETRYDKLVGEKDGDFYFCDYIFYEGEDFKGATGTVLTPVTKEDYLDRTEGEGLLDYLREIWQQAVSAGQTEKSLEDWAEEVINIDGDEAVFDLSGYDLWGQLRQIGYNEEEYPVFQCSGGGRCFGRFDKFDKVYDQELLDKIRKIEK